MKTPSEITVRQIVDDYVEAAKKRTDGVEHDLLVENSRGLIDYIDCLIGSF